MRLSQKVKQSKEILAKYVHEKEVLERSAVNTEEVSTASVQFMTAAGGRARRMAHRSSQLRAQLVEDDDSSVKQSESDDDMFHQPTTFETAVMLMEASMSELESEFGALAEQLSQTLPQQR